MKLAEPSEFCNDYMIGKILCKLGFHAVIGGTRYIKDINANIPNIDKKIRANIVTEYITHFECRRCGKVMGHSHMVWDGEEFHEKTEEPE